MLEIEKRAVGTGLGESLVELEKGLWMMEFVAAVSSNSLILILIFFF